MPNPIKSDVLSQLRSPQLTDQLQRHGLKWVLGLGATVVLAPLAFFLIQGLLGLIAAFTLGMVGIHAAPVLSLKLSNWRRRTMRDEVASHPLDALENEGVRLEKQTRECRERTKDHLAALFRETAEELAGMDSSQAKRCKAGVASAGIRKRQLLSRLAAIEAINAAYQARLPLARLEHKFIETSRAIDAAERDFNAPERRWTESTALDALRHQMNRAMVDFDLTLNADSHGLELVAEGPAAHPKESS